MRILELCLSPDLGGLELYVLKCTVALRETDSVQVLLNPQGKLARRFDEEQRRWSAFSPGARMLTPFAAVRLARYLDANEIDIVHVHWGKDVPLAVLAKVLSRRKPKLVYTRHMDITKSKRDPYHRFIYSHIDLLLVITQRMADAVRGFLPGWFAGRIVTLYHGVSAPEAELNPEDRAAERVAYGLRADDFLVGIVGRIKYEKGQHLLVEAIRRLRAQGHLVSGIIVGTVMNQDYVAGLREEIQQQGLGEAIRIHAFVEDPRRLMQACDAVVLASYRETFGLVLVEAMRAGVAVIGSNGGGVSEIIEQGETGLMFEAGDAASLAAAIERLLVEPGLRQRLAIAGKASADRRFNERQHFTSLREHLAALV